MSRLVRLLVGLGLAGMLMGLTSPATQGDGASQPGTQDNGAEATNGAVDPVGTDGAESQEPEGFLSRVLFEVGENNVSLLDVLFALLTILTAYQVSRFLQELVERGLVRIGAGTEGTVGTVRRAIHYSVMLIGVVVSLGMIGINLQTLLTAGALFAVAFGFAMQNIAQNFVSGIILMVERSIKPGDVLTLEGRVVRVVEMGIRATVVRTLDDEEMIVPNSTLVQNTVTNYTLRDSLYRLRAVVGVAYSSDMEEVRNTLEECARTQDWRVKDHAPRVHLIEFGDSSVVWEVSVWIQHPWHGPRMRSRLYQAMWWALKEKGISIAFPQLDLHLDPRVEKALQQSNWT